MMLPSAAVHGALFAEPHRTEIHSSTGPSASTRRCPGPLVRADLHRLECHRSVHAFTPLCRGRALLFISGPSARRLIEAPRERCRVRSVDQTSARLVLPHPGSSGIPDHRDPTADPGRTRTAVRRHRRKSFLRRTASRFAPGLLGENHRCSPDRNAEKRRKESSGADSAHLTEPSWNCRGRRSSRHIRSTHRRRHRENVRIHRRCLCCRRRAA